MPLTIEIKHLEPDIALLEMSGRITLGNDCRHVEWTAEKLVSERRTKVVFDLTNISFVDSTGIGIIVMVAGKMKEAGGKLRLAGANKHVEQTLKMTSVDRLVPLHPTAVAAIAAF